MKKYLNLLLAFTVTFSSVSECVDKISVMKTCGTTFLSSESCPVYETTARIICINLEKVSNNENTRTTQRT